MAHVFWFFTFPCVVVLGVVLVLTLVAIAVDAPSGPPSSRQRG